jgi:hypothetical protein
MSELVAIGAEKRVRWVRTLGNLVLTLTAEHTSVTPGNLRDIQTRLREETLRAFIISQVLVGTTGTPLDPRRCGLPVITTSAKVEAVGDPDGLRFTVRGTAADDETAVEFELEANTSIQIEVPPGTSPDIIAFPTGASIDPTSSTIQATKRLKFRGLITLDRFDRPLGGELTTISAREDDSGLTQWVITDVSSSWGSSGLFSVLPPGVFDSFKIHVIPPEVLKGFTGSVLPPEVVKGFTGSVLPPEVLKGFFSTVVWPKPTSPKSADTQAPEYDSAEPESENDDQSNGDVGEGEESDEENGAGT